MLKYRLDPYCYGGNVSDYFVANHGSGINISKIPKSSKEPDFISFSSQRKLIEFCRLYGVEPPAWPPQNFQRVLSQIAPEIDHDEFQWFNIMGVKRYMLELQHMAQSFEQSVAKHNIGYWHDIYNRYVEGLFYEMQHCVLDKTLYEKYKSEATASQMEILESFKQDKQGYVSPAYYTGTETKTGRLKVMHGPNILHLKKEYRDMIISAHGSRGKIVYLDYSSLEPRILLCVSNPSLIGSLPQDIYSKMLADLNLSEKIPRTVAKTAILAALYGQKEENTVKTLSNYIGSAEDFLRLVNDYFGIEKLKEKLAGDLLKTGGRYILNYYGRPIFCEDTKPYALLNYYVQSTAVDVAMLGFYNIVNRLKEKCLLDKIRPIFILHDALFLDIHEDAYHVIPKIERLGSTGIKGFKNIDFWLRSE
jgi:hypothetical protein